MKKSNPILYLSVIAILLAVVYIGETSTISVQGYVIQQKQKELADIKQESVEVHTQLAQYNSIGTVRQNSTAINMQASTFVYLDDKGQLVKR
jgi:hypothetical protein